MDDNYRLFLIKGNKKTIKLRKVINLRITQLRKRRTDAILASGGSKLIKELLIEDDLDLKNNIPKIGRYHFDAFKRKTFKKDMRYTLNESISFITKKTTNGSLVLDEILRLLDYESCDEFNKQDLATAALCFIAAEINRKHFPYYSDMIKNRWF